MRTIVRAHLVLVVLLATATASRAGVTVKLGPAITLGVSPPRFEIALDSASSTHALRVFNFGTETLQLQGSVNAWDFDEDNQLRVVEPTERTLDQWIVINPLRFSIPPGESQTVRFSIRPKVLPAPGEYRAMIYLEQPPTLQDSLTVRGRMGVAVYAYAGNIERVGDLDVTVVSREQGPLAAFDITSRGSAHVRLSGQYAVWPVETYPGTDATGPVEGLGEPGVAVPDSIVDAGFLPGMPVLPGDRRTLPMSLAPHLPAGDYILDINGDLSGKPLDLAVPFTIAPLDEERITSAK